MALVLATESPGGEAEIFASLQGEGPSIGRPSTFIRTSRCNLACSWCDTAYTWRFTGDKRAHRDGETYERKANQVKLSPEAAAEKISAFSPRRLVITGGEPLLQAGALAEMLTLLPNHRVEVETNGTIIPPADFDEHIAQYTVSPKLVHSGNTAELARPDKPLSHWALEPRAVFKFVIAEPGDVETVRLLQTAYDLSPERIFLMAEGVTSDVLNERETWLAPHCIKYGFTLSPRLHIHLYGDKRGT